MDMLAETGQEYWRDVLLAGGFTAIPHWTSEPVEGVGRHHEPVPDDVLAGADRLTDELGESLSTVLLAAHAVVLAALAGERDVTTGYLVGGGASALPCRLTTSAESWRGVLRDVRRSESELLAHADAPVEDLRLSLRVRQQFETTFDPTFDPTCDPALDAPSVASDGDGALPAGVVLEVGTAALDERRALRLRYRTDALDAAAAARIAGYHLAALRLLVTDPDAGPRCQSLLSPSELRFQVEQLAGPAHELPDRRMHEIFEDWVVRQPDAVAAVQGDRRWTYAELNVRANQLGRALQARGLQREQVVAVVTERNLDWMAAVLAILKAGGVYLPLEPHFPAGRIAKALSRSECTLVLTEQGSTATLDEALVGLPDVHKLVVRETYLEGHAEGNLGVEVGPDQLAYLLFTSGSTGEPKGAMCEHAGMLNHMYAKIIDLGIGTGEVIPQTGPQCFDISVWQLLAALLVGGRTLIVEQDVVLDVERLVDTLVEERAGVLQVVPSYLDAVLSYLEQHPRELPDLHTVCPTGDFLKKELVQRWFVAQPTIAMVNTYGLTETSDDAVHEIMNGVPQAARVPLGRPIINTHVYVTDENLQPVPLGAPGLIVFSGVCVGRGYVNDPERTAAMFATDPHRPGERVCVTGDYGRWMPDGKLDFLGRRDNQVKIRGFRIEIGEIENALLRVPGIRDGAVVVADGAGGGESSKRLVAFYTGAQPLDPESVRAGVGQFVPEYMVPPLAHWRETMPLTPNGKIDRKALTVLAAELGTEEAPQDREAPRTATEHRLAAAWAEVLGVGEDQIGRQDHFFDVGGTSLSAVKVAIAMRRTVSLKDLTQHPVLADLAELVDRRSSQSQPSPTRPAATQPAATQPADAHAADAAHPAPDGRLLQLLSESDDGPAGWLVCFPYGGGNAVNYQPMARALRGSGLAVYAVELPGHDIAAEREPFAPMDAVVARVVDEIERGAPPAVLLWGHSAGAAFAVATATALAERGLDVRRVFVGAQLLGDASSRLAAADELTARSTAEIAARLVTDRGYTELGELDAMRADHVGQAYRHDCLSAHRYLAEALATPGKVSLAAPVTVVVADDDQATAGHAERFTDWLHLTHHVDLYEIGGGGHYFLRTRPDAAARAVLDTVRLVTAH